MMRTKCSHIHIVSAGAMHSGNVESTTVGSIYKVDYIKCSNTSAEPVPKKYTVDLAQNGIYKTSHRTQFFIYLKNFFSSFMNTYIVLIDFVQLNFHFICFLLKKLRHVCAHMCRYSEDELKIAQIDGTKTKLF